MRPTNDVVVEAANVAATSSDDPPSDVPAEGATEFTGEDLVLSYGDADDPVIDGESIRVPPGEVTALVGPNGSGKSTLLKGLANQLALDAGTVLLDGQDVHGLETKELAQQLGLLTQENVSPGSLTVEKLVEHGRYPHRGFFDSLSDEDRAAIDDAIDLTGVDHLRERQVGSLSGGQKQLVWIAMVLAQDTDVLLLDEPTTFLDLHHQLEVMEIVGRLRDESDITVVLVLHDIAQAARYADYMVALDDGSIYARGTATEVVTEGMLADVFEIEAIVEPGRHGPRITPLGPLHEDEEDDATDSDDECDGDDANSDGQSDGDDAKTDERSDDDDAERTGGVDGDDPADGETRERR